MVNASGDEALVAAYALVFCISLMYRGNKGTDSEFAARNIEHEGSVAPNSESVPLFPSSGPFSDIFPACNR